MASIAVCGGLLGVSPAAAFSAAPVSAEVTALPQDDARRTFLSSDEFYLNAGGGNDAGYVQALSIEMLGRAPSPSELSVLLGRVRDLGRSATVDQLWYAPETLNLQARTMIEIFLGRSASASEVTSWAATIRDAGPTGARNLLMESAEYLGRVVPAPGGTTAPSPTPTPATFSLPTTPWWGGSSYYSKFPKAAASGWTNPSFFPIAVFFGKPGHATALKAAGINTYMGAEHDGSAISTITSTGISVIAQDEWTTGEIGNDPRVVGWHVSDECEMGYAGCSGNTETARLATQKQLAATFTRNDGRFLQSNFGNGVLGTFWAPTTMPQFVGTVDVTSVDKYAYTSPDVSWVISQAGTWPKSKSPATASAYGWLQDRMETFSASAKPNWVFVETAKPYLTESGATTIKPEQIEGAVWNAIIHGAAGIAYFQHNNNGSCGTYSILQCGTALTSKITAVNQQVQSLAPVINSPSYSWSFGAGLDTSLKTSNGSAYIFAMTDGSTGSKSFTLPAGLTGTVEVVGENRSITPANGTFSDTFASEYTHHIYRIALS